MQPAEYSASVKSSLNPGRSAVNLVAQNPDVSMADYERRQKEKICNPTGPN